MLDGCNNHFISDSARYSRVTYESIPTSYLPSAVFVHFKQSQGHRPSCGTLPFTSPLPRTPTHWTLPTLELILLQEVRGLCEIEANFMAPQAVLHFYPDVAEWLKTPRVHRANHWYNCNQLRRSDYLGSATPPDLDLKQFQGAVGFGADTKQ